MGMTYDEARGNIVIFGGWNRVRQSVFRDTWTWDGTGWTRQSPDRSPQRRYWAGMSYHAGSARVVLTLGEDSGENYLDTWTWDGSTWQRAPAQLMPRKRNAPGMTYDSLRDEAVLFGGYLAPGHTILFQDTWIWDGTAWTERKPSPRPGGRYGHSMAFDTARGVAILFGGRRDEAVFGDTWSWDGSVWTKLSPSSSPPARSFASMAYDATRGETVLFGGIGADGETLDDTWVWDGTTWLQRHPDVSPPPRWSSGMAFDVALGETVLFGGAASDGVHNYGDTWTWDGSEWTLRQG
jgi:hypothetical protein